jgi:hypothetical protein
MNTTQNTDTRTAEIKAARAADEKIAAAWDTYWTAMSTTRTWVEQKKHSTKRLRYARTAEGRTIYEAEIKEAEAKIAEIAQEARPLADAARELDRSLYTGWTRFYLVKHIHNTQHCSSFRMTTQVGWLPKVSGLTEAEAVAEYSATLCTICFHSAPVES